MAEPVDGVGDEPLALAAPPSLLLLLWSWILIGAFSYGGGAATLLLLRREWVERRRWTSGPTFDQIFVISKLCPGINILAQTILLGKHIAGWKGIVVSLSGLLLPAVSITIGLTAVFTLLEAWPPSQEALAGVAPATAGLLVALVVQVGSGQVRKRHLALYDLVFAGGCALLLGIARWSPPLILFISALWGVLFPRLGRKQEEL